MARNGKECNFLLSTTYNSSLNAKFNTFCQKFANVCDFKIGMKSKFLFKMFWDVIHKNARNACKSSLMKYVLTVPNLPSLQSQQFSQQNLYSISCPSLPYICLVLNQKNQKKIRILKQNSLFFSDFCLKKNWKTNYKLINDFIFYFILELKEFNQSLDRKFIFNLFGF